MNDDIVYRIRSNLKSQSYLVNDSWLRECIEYYISENTNASLNAVQAFVTSQWLLSDLREINNEKGSLPPNINRQEKILLQGKYVIQVDKMLDISQSKYNQIQKIRNVSEVNIKATEIEAPAWEPRGKRMMHMYLTDGAQDFTAIEYRPIKALKDTLLPGFKLMIIGPVMCRKGVIMLKEENYREIGGEVDSLLKINALENVLARALDMEENENPYADDNQEAIADQTDNAFPEDEFDINLDEITQIERLSMESAELPTDPPISANNSNPSNNMRITRTEEIRTNNSSKRAETNNYSTSRNQMGNNIRRELEQAAIPKNFYDPLHSTNGNQSSALVQNRRASGNELKIVSRTQLKPMISSPSSCQLKDNDSVKLYNRGTEGTRYDCTGRADLPSTSKASAVVFDEDDDFDIDGFEDELDENTFKKNKPFDGITNNPKVSNETITGLGKRIEPIKKPFLVGSKDNSPGGQSPTFSAAKRSADTMSPLRGSSKVIRLETTRAQLNNTKNRKITDFAEKISPKEEMPPKICDFICDVIKEPLPVSATYRTVRGRVTQIGKLLKKDKNWDLKATITDSTASVEIMFASQVLEELIGFAVPEFLEKRKLRKTNPEVEEYLRGGFRKAEIKVQRMDVLMELELSVENGIPKVINTTELTEEQKQLIEKRMKMMAV